MFAGTNLFRGGGDFMGAGHDRTVVVQVLGGFGVRRGLSRLKLRPSTRRLIALLAVEGAIARDDAAVRLFEDRRLERAYANLRTLMWRLRDDAKGLVVEEADGLRIDADVVDFQEAVSVELSDRSARNSSDGSAAIHWSAPVAWLERAMARSAA
ncbi:hypothetical protein [Kribbella sp. NPDC023855]|uniref:hypothetical protein n=1 Tax=Kribbella sp. NPDC023855 TaxID=3154698 RepID=UPI0033D5EBF8